MGELADRLGELAAVPSRAARGAAEKLTERLGEEFEHGVDPYGNPWAPLAERTLEKHGEPPLTDSGDMAAATIAKPSRGAGVELVVPFPGAIHQTGAKRGAWKLPKRPILPEGDELPADWKGAIDEALDEAFGEKLGGR